MPPRRKPQTIASPKWTNVKSQGELAESVFVVKAQALGLSISEPKGDNQPFDFHIQSPLGTFRIQVKSCWVAQQNRFTARIQPHLADAPGSYDFLVVYIAPSDSWYVIPSSEVSGPVRLYPDIPDSRGRYEKYRNAWRLITGNPADDTHQIGLTIHAAADEGAKKPK